MVPCMEEIEELLGAVLLGGRPRANPGLTLLQALLGVDTMLRVSTLLPYAFKGILKHNIFFVFQAFFFFSQ